MPSVRHWKSSVGLHIDASPSTLSGWMYPIKRQRSHPPALVRALRRPLQRQKHCARVFTGQDSQVDVKLELDDPPTHEEIKKVTMQLKAGKSLGIDGIPAEVYQYRGEEVLDKLGICSPTIRKKSLYHRTSGMQSLSLCTTTRQKNQDCSSYWSITLFSIAGKVLTRRIGWIGSSQW